MCVCVCVKWCVYLYVIMYVCMRACNCILYIYITSIYAYMIIHVCDRMWVGNATTEQHSHLNSQDISTQLPHFWLSIASQVWWGALVHAPLHYKGEKGRLNRRGSQHTDRGTLFVDGNFANQVTSLFLDIGPRSYKAGLFGILWWVGFPSGGPRWPMPKFAWDRGSSDCWTCTGSSRFSIPDSDHPWGHCLARSCRGRSP